MTLLESLQKHKGGLLRIKTELYWYGGRGWDNIPGRICLILDAAAHAAAEAAATTTATPTAASPTAAEPAAFLLIDGKPQWIWVAEKDVEVFNEAG